MPTLTPAQIDDPAKLQLALQEMTFDSEPKPLGYVFTDGEHFYGHRVDEEIILWRLTLVDGEYDDLRFVLLPESELAERSVLDMLLEACRDGAWE